METRSVNWSELPRELLSMIGNILDTWIDVLRFHSVCNSWRSSISPFHQTDLPPPLKIPFRCSTPQEQRIFLSKHTIYRLEPIHGNNNTDFSNSNSISARLPSKACLVKVPETRGPFHANRIVVGHPASVPNFLSSLDFRMVKLGKSYGLSYIDLVWYMIWMSKVIKYPDTAASAFLENCSIFVIYNGGKLGYVNCGDQKLTFKDVYKGQPYVVDKSRTVSWKLKLTRFLAPLLGSGGGQKYLVESCGQLYMVDKYFENDDEQKKIEGQGPSNGTRRIFTYGGALTDGEHYKRMRPLGQGKKTIDFKVYKIDEEGGNWVQVANLGA
ncbi:hypothetical protein FEM48_Zijuj08G0081200 [Ziziphus jujuba var. spinosa]|uniref:KIB1-4 beta-propeller domain-containing protein n=1 Tax=Ziziphus jujuba var. spinosa TaxID=714518 RepID=A0A978UXY6_ZIZJJ|nr:hypothetical protein FEM48_Zijuj08G0081200 [Ziziphus jujuba var. spinosa]